MTFFNGIVSCAVFPSPVTYNRQKANTERGKTRLFAGQNFMANWSKLKWRILIGSLGGPRFAIRLPSWTAHELFSIPVSTRETMVPCFGELLFQNVAQKKTVPC